MESHRLRHGAFAALLVGLMGLGVVSSAFAQGAGASIEGVARDQQGGVLPGVTVTLRNQDSGVTRTSVTATDGRYRFLALAPGRYHLNAALSGFRIEGRRRHHDHDRTVVDAGFLDGPPVRARVGHRKWSGADGGHDQERGGRGRDATADPDPPRQFETVPEPCLADAGTSQDASRSFYNNVTIGAGTSFYSNGFLVDGVNNTWAEEGEPRQNFPQGAVQEFKVNTSGFPAEFGLATGGLVQIVTKSGSNRWSGEGFEYFRDKSLNALNLYEEQRHDEFGDPKPGFRRNQFGGSLGGPIIQDRTHFFVSAERTVTDQFFTVSTGKPQFYSALEGTFLAPVTSDLFVGRVDHQINSDQTLFFRYGQEGGKKTCLGCGGTAAANAGFDFQKPA